MWQGKLDASLAQAMASYPERSAFYDYNGANYQIAWMGCNLTRVNNLAHRNERKICTACREILY